MEEIFDFIRDCGMFFLATVDGDWPKVRPLGAIDLIDGKLYIFTGKNKETFRQLERNPKAELCACKGDSFVRVCGELKLDERAEVVEHMISSYPQFKNNEKDYSDAALMYFTNGSAIKSTFGQEPKVYAF